MLGGAVDTVPRDAGLVAYDGAPLSGDAVEQGGFSDIRPAHNHHCGAWGSHTFMISVMRAPYYPIFLDLRDRPILVVGAGKVALRKTKGLVEAAAQVTVVAPECQPEFETLPVRLVRRRFRASDLDGAVLVFAATDDRRTNQRIGLLAKRRGVFANIADSREECDFLVPARLNRADVQIAISTGGRSPRAAAEWRRRLEEAL
jgi:siroheme synthase (precorrin-2 oxidase/ferrochelatase)